MPRTCSALRGNSDFVSKIEAEGLETTNIEVRNCFGSF